MSELKDGVPCGAPGCLNHVTHPCEKCGRINGKAISIASTNDELKEQTIRWLENNNPDNEEIADKFVEAINKTYDLTVQRHQLKLQEHLFKIITEPPKRPDKSFWGFW